MKTGISQNLTPAWSLPASSQEVLGVNGVLEGFWLIRLLVTSDSLEWGGDLEKISDWACFQEECSLIGKDNDGMASGVQKLQIQISTLST